MAEYVGFDVSKEETAFCVMDESGKVLARGKVASDGEIAGCCARADSRLARRAKLIHDRVSLS